MGFIDGLADFASGFLSGVSDVLGKVGSAFKTVAETLGVAVSIAFPELAPAVALLQQIGTTLLNVAKALGYNELDVDPETPYQPGVIIKDLEEKGELPKKEDGMTTTEYINKLISEHKDFDHVAYYNSLGEKDQFVCNQISNALYAQALSEKLGISITGNFLVDMKKMGISDDQLKVILSFLGKNGVDSVDVLTNYVKGDLKNVPSKDIDIVVQSFDEAAKVTPGKSSSDIEIEYSDNLFKDLEK